LTLSDEVRANAKAQIIAFIDRQFSTYLDFLEEIERDGKKREYERKWKNYIVINKNIIYRISKNIDLLEEYSMRDVWENISASGEPRPITMLVKRETS
jgi:hypothetical protein